MKEINSKFQRMDFIPFVGYVPILKQRLKLIQSTSPTSDVKLYGFFIKEFVIGIYNFIIFLILIYIIRNFLF